MSKHEDDYGRLMGYCNDCGGGEVASRWEHLGAQVQGMFRLKARAALVAAQGAAPQADALPSNRENCPGSGGHAGCGNFCSMCFLTAPVLPSSGVDEYALAEVIAEAQNVPFVGARQKAIARAVAEWLNASTTRKEQK